MKKRFNLYTAGHHQGLCRHPTMNTSTNFPLQNSSSAVFHNGTESDSNNGTVSAGHWAVSATRTENLVCPPVIMGLGFVGNLLSFIVMSRKRMRTTSIAVYCMALAVSDSLVCNSIYPNIMSMAIREQMLFEGVGTNIYLFVSFLGSHTSTWLIVAVTIDRFISVTFPLKANHMCTPGKAKIVVAAIVMTFAVFDGVNCLWLLKSEVLTNDSHMFVGRTDTATKYLNYTWHLIDAVIMNLFPSPIIITFNIITIVKLRKARQTRHLISQQSTITTTPGGTPGESSDKKLYAMLISVTMVFATITIPYYAWTIYTGYLEHWKNQNFEENAKRALVLFSFIHLYCINHSINFYIYCVTGQKFREELYDVFRDISCCCRVIKSSTQERGMQTKTNNTFTLSSNKYLASTCTLDQ